VLIEQTARRLLNTFDTALMCTTTASTSEQFARLRGMSAGDPARSALRGELIEQNLQRVRMVAARMSLRLPMGQVDFDDLVGWGALGLIDAVDRFDPKRGTRFSTYAPLRIRGAILDGLRGMDHLCGCRRGRHAGESLPKIVHFSALRDAQRRQARRPRARQHQQRSAREGEAPDISDGGRAQRRLRQLESDDAVRRLTCWLNRDQRMTLDLCEVERISQVQVARAIGVTPGRVSQVRRAALSILRDDAARTRRILQ
jgi:RNA polymerase sigma factor (sigma-70 family)